MDVKYTIDLSRFSKEELNRLFKDGAITRHEYVAELNSRKDQEADRIKMTDGLGVFNEGKLSR